MTATPKRSTTSDGAPSAGLATRAAVWFRLIAFAEAISWVGLLAGMYVKYLGEPRTEVGVKIFGPVHGGVFIAFVVGALLVGIARRWRASTWLMALLAAVVPLGSVIFLIWADRTGRVDPSETVATNHPAAESA
jgi:integral membrane protein